MSGIGEASIVLGLVSSIIAICEGAHEIYEAVSDVKGLPRKFQLAAEQIPLVLHILVLAEQNIQANAVSQDGLQSAMPILERCKESATGLKDIFDKTIPPKDASRTERYKKAVGIKLKSNKVKELMEEIIKSMELLAQNQVFQDAETLKDIKEAIEQLSNISDEEEQSRYTVVGGPMNVLNGPGTQENQSMIGDNNNQYNAKTQNFGGNQVENQYNIAHHHHSREDRIPILQRLPYIKGATFDPYDQDNPTCHSETRTGLLCQIQDWAQQPHSKRIFLLNGMAGTGKSTISWTIAKWATGQGKRGVIDLGASFFFKRGGGDRSNASRFFPTIARGLVSKIPGLDTLITEVVTSDPSIFDKALGEQFDKLIYQPLQKVNIQPGGCSTFILVVDALDECGARSETKSKTSDIEVILSLWSQISQVTSICLKLFLTSRPDLSTQLGFSMISTNIYQVMILHEVPGTIIEHDISVYLRDEFSKIRKRYNALLPSQTRLDDTWPHHGDLEALVKMAVPLFIVAATVCRYIGDLKRYPPKRLEKILKFPKNGQLGQLGQMAQTYLPVLSQTFDDPDEEEEFYYEFRKIVGSIVTLAEPLSTTSLAALLDMDRDVILHHLSALNSVLVIYPDPGPVHLFHLSFGEFLLSDKLQHEPFRVDGPTSHQMLVTKCLELLSRPDGLQQNMCGLKYPGQPRREINRTTIDERLTPALQYACQYWVYHVQHTKISIRDDDEVHVFLQKHFLHWLEALSLMGRITEVIKDIGELQSLVSSTNSARLSPFLEDAKRIIVANRYVIDIAPLQIYSSAIIFAPQNSPVRCICGDVPSWLLRYPITPETWNSELQKLEGHNGPVTAVAFSHDGPLLASASLDRTVKLWNSSTGQEVQSFEGHTDSVNALAFSYDDSLLASASGSYNPEIWGVGTGREKEASKDCIIILWSISLGQEIRRLKGHTASVSAVAFSNDNSLLASASCDKTIILWNTSTGQDVQKLDGHTRSINAVVFSYDSSLLASASDDETIILWSTSQKVQILKGHTGPVSDVVFSYNGSLLASASEDETVILWNLSTGEVLRRFEGHTDYVTTVTFSRDNSLLASASDDKTIRLWNLSTGKEVQKLKGHTDYVTAVTLSQNDLILASASGDRTIRLWSPTKSQQAQNVEGYLDPVPAVAFSYDNTLLAATLSNSTLRLWDSSTSQKVQELKGHAGPVSAVVFSHDGSLLATISEDETVILWNLSTGEVLRRLEGHTDCVNAVIFSYNNSLLASASKDLTVKLWSPSIDQELRELKGHTGSVSTVAFSHDSSLLASSSEDLTIRLWEPSTGQSKQELKGNAFSLTIVAFSHDDSLLASTSSDCTIRLWNPSTGQETQRFKGHVGTVRAVAFSYDDSLLASASTDLTVRLWSPSTGQEIWRLQGHTSLVMAVAFSYDGLLLASASKDETIRLWDLSTGHELRKLKNARAIQTLSFTVDRRTLLTNRGAIATGSEDMACETSPHTAVMIRSDWVSRGNRNFLWLPQEYRHLSAFHGNLLAIGLNSGQVSFIELA